MRLSTLVSVPKCNLGQACFLKEACFFRHKVWYFSNLKTDEKTCFFSDLEHFVINVPRKLKKNNERPGRSLGHLLQSNPADFIFLVKINVT